LGLCLFHWSAFDWGNAFAEHKSVGGHRAGQLLELIGPYLREREKKKE